MGRRQDIWRLIDFVLSFMRELLNLWNIFDYVGTGAGKWESDSLIKTKQPDDSLASLRLVVISAQCFECQSSEI